MTTIVYITLQADDAIGLYDMEEGGGSLTLRESIAVPGGPAPLCTDPDERFLYCALRGSNQIATFGIGSDGALTRIGSAALRSDPCYISVDKGGCFLLSAYYGAGMCSLHRLGDDGVPLTQDAEYIETGKGAHCIQMDASNRFAYLPHVLPNNEIRQYVLDSDAGRLAPNSVPAALGHGGQGPRHYVYHPILSRLYTSNEQECSVTAYEIDPRSGVLTEQETLSTLPEAWEGTNTCAQIHMHPSGDYLYVSNRGHDSIALFGLDDQGHLSAQGHQPTEPTPRVFNLDPSGRFLYAAGQGSGRLAGYRVDSRTGLLDAMWSIDVGETPMWVLPLDLAS